MGGSWDIKCNQKGSKNGIVLAEARRRRRHKPSSPPNLYPAGIVQTTEQKVKAPNEKYNYNQVIYLSNLFYEAQRAGKLPSDNRIPWRRDSNIADGFDSDVELSGGYYDAGDYLIFGWPLASSTTVLIWGLLEYEDAYTEAGELGHMLATVKWPLDWLLKAHVAPDALYVQVGDGKVEHRYWGRPEFESKPRPALLVNASVPGTEPLADAAAAMAAGFLAFQHRDPVYAHTLLLHAQQLFEAAMAHPRKFTLSSPYYESSGYRDELAWAAAWLYKATGCASYLSHALNLAEIFSKSDDMGAFGWDSKDAGVYLLLYQLTRDTKHAKVFASYLADWLPQASSATAIKRTPRGLAYYLTWGPLRWAANTAFLALLAADMGLSPGPYRAFARSQIHYMLGDNGNFSYVVGFGSNFPKAIHHRAASCGRYGCICDTTPSANTLYGALVGGPDEKDTYLDDCRDYKHTEVSVDYNAGFQGAVAGLKHLSLMGLLESF
ncbi:hypothetical protein NSK_003544 [Nannochloropsis salina CCMP1776]|uniref:Endoglucanase n=1 Tax=Nannochloropsis salina CCMP1776 TaxID=1027361 RepID=A0A4D9D0D2_9STRA|nr:hypothetical protein NSK_003544 [Nannochloropsis salina CCMP1776]|eukprot:TFJ85121.1 hypothetical protein NSK_003544 [Nannochloropsis salina CCMP1776]